MSNSYKIAVLPGDGIGPEVTAESVETIYNAPQQKYTQQLLSAIPGHGLRAITA